MNVRNFALVYGIVFLLVGIAGFIPAFVVPDSTGQPLAINAGSGMLFGLFHVNVLHDLVHIAFGLWGLAVCRNAVSSARYARSVAVIYAAFVIMGLVPGLDTVFGLVPLHGYDVWLHAVLAAVAAFFGFAWRETAAPTPRHA
jgi:uncharacterized protein DUF4383